MSSPAAIVDAAATGRVVVVGSLPDTGRDLDLLVRDGDVPPIEIALAAAGFRNRFGEWARFAECTAEGVDLVPASSWGLPTADLDDLFLRAVPLAGFVNLVRPAPEHALLVLARLTGASGSLPPKRRRRIDAALAEAPDGWRRARARAGTWSLATELDRLERLHRGTVPHRPGVRRLRRPRVIALSGIDGSGKSSQARALQAALERLGYEVAVEWTPFGQDAWLDRLAVPVKRLLGRSQQFSTGASPRETGLERTTGTVLRERSRVLNDVWSAVVALANGLTQLRTIARHSSRGRIVIYDRYALDSTVQLRFRYGMNGGPSVRRRLIELMAPHALASFYLDVPPETSLARKHDRWTFDDLAAQARLYREEYGRLGAVRLDGLRPADELAAEIAETVWRALD
jgi:thymidylate kinase